MAFDIGKQFGTDEVLELDGVWEELDDDSAILVARLGNKDYLEAYKKIPRGIRRMIEKDTLNDARVTSIVCNLMSRTILRGWKGMQDQGKTVKYSQENAQKILEKYPTFRDFVWELANDFQRFHSEGLEEDAKNSKSVSDGS